jgi:hypothetical protein
MAKSDKRIEKRIVAGKGETKSTPKMLESYGKPAGSPITSAMIVPMQKVSEAAQLCVGEIRIVDEANFLWPGWNWRKSIFWAPRFDANEISSGAKLTWIFFGRINALRF